MKPLVIQRCANGVILSPMAIPGEPAPQPTDIFVFTDGNDHALVKHLTEAIRPITHVELSDIKRVLEDAPAMFTPPVLTETPPGL